MISPALLSPPRRHYQPPEPPVPVPTWWDYFQDHRDWPMPPQQRDWTCSVCSLTWVLQATGLEPDATREGVAYQIGYPSCVNEWVGLENSDCLVRVLAEHGVQAYVEWMGYDRALQVAGQTTGILNSTRWYHFVAVRGINSVGQLWVANSAGGYQGIYESINRAQWDQWAGSWQMIWIDR